MSESPTYTPLVLSAGTPPRWTISVELDGRVIADGEVNWDEVVEALKKVVTPTVRGSFWPYSMANCRSATS